MTNSTINRTFLQAIDAKTRGAILTNIAATYQIDNATAYDEVTHEDAEHLCEYVTGRQRAAVDLMMKKHAVSHVK